MKRRSALLAAVATGAAAAGVGTALWRARRRPGPADDPVWSQRFEQPDGGELVIAAFRGRPLLLNFWATWCPPCVNELPLLDRFQRARVSSGWQVVGLAVDQRVPVQDFLEKHPVGFPVGIVGTDGLELAHRLGNGPGALPFTVVFNRAGTVVQRKLGEVQPADLDAWVHAAEKTAG